MNRRLIAISVAVSTVCTLAAVVILSNLAVDMLYGVLDPRVRYGT